MFSDSFTNLARLPPRLKPDRVIFLFSNLLISSWIFSPHSKSRGSPMLSPGVKLAKNVHKGLGQGFGSMLVPAKIRLTY